MYGVSLRRSRARRKEWGSPKAWRTPKTHRRPRGCGRTVFWAEDGPEDNLLAVWRGDGGFGRAGGFLFLLLFLAVWVCFRRRFRRGVFLLASEGLQFYGGCKMRIQPLARALRLTYMLAVVLELQLPQLSLETEGSFFPAFAPKAAFEWVLVLQSE